jgi:hypothetical protein
VRVDEVLALVRESFSGLQANRVLALMRQFYPDLTIDETFACLRKRFPEVKVGEMLELIRKSVPEAKISSVLELIRKLFSDVNFDMELFDVLRRLWPEESASVRSLFSSPFPFVAGHPVEGIIAHLTQKHGGNVHDRGVVEISAKSTYPSGTTYAASNAADLTAGSRFRSADS